MRIKVKDLSKKRQWVIIIEFVNESVNINAMIANKKYLVIERLVTLKRIYSYIQKKFLHLMKKKEEEENKSSIRKTMHTVDATRI